MPVHELLRPLCAVAILSLGLCAGCGGDRSHDLGGSPTDGVAGAPPESPGGIGLCSEGADLELIDDMEDQDSALLDIGGRRGTWFRFNDEKGIFQEPDQLIFPMVKLEPKREASEFAAWTRGAGFPDWGAGIGFDINLQRKYDSSGYAGFAFWARRGIDGSPRLRAEVLDRNTAPQGPVCDQEAMCDRDQACDPALMACFDNFGVAVELDTDWQFYSYRWSDLEQAGWSGNTYPEIDRTAIYGIRFQSGPVDEFEFWLDDIAFICPER